MLPNGKRESGFFALNFTLAELKTLYAKQALPGRDQSSKHKYRCDSSVPSCIPSLSAPDTQASRRSAQLSCHVLLLRYSELRPSRSGAGDEVLD
jgi:hypothetical protein